ncbi:MAG: sigma-70 family RNA polymerase sigma factor, partial [Chitinophagaceae bacterium]
VRIMLNQCYHKKQKFSFQKEISTEDGIEEKSVPMFSNQRTDTGKTVINTELKQVLEDAVEHIPEDYRIVFTLRELNGMSVNETAEALNISESNVKVRLNRAKGMLRNEIQKTYSPGEIFEFNLIYCDGMVSRVMKAIEQLKADEDQGK